MFRHGQVLCALLGAAVMAAEGEAQTVLDRTPDLAGAWVGTPGVLHFNFLHRFSISSAPERKVSSTPTFLMAASLPRQTLVGAHYASNSELSPRYPNEWEFFGRMAPLSQGRGAPLDASVQVGYNLAAEGLDAEAAVARRVGRLRVLAAFRLLAEPGSAGGADVGLGGGAVFRLTRYLGLSGDIVSLVDREPGERVAWAAGLNLVIPHTPHTLSLHATNSNNATLQSSSRGTGETRYGFEFTIPLTLSRYFGGRPSPPAVPSRAEPEPSGSPAASDTVSATIEDFTFRPNRIVIAPGTTVRWTNGGQVTHSVTSEDAGLDTGLFEPGERRSLTFTSPGSYSFHCTPHPFMRGVVEVR